ncbi:ABC transporter substrate-binding protein [Anaerolentibacter hominis]|uniref:ABC transporter substrate-binding protein n=1 Tax=Anaerolentibacter hominis TaxID=3079009 RepID=UPI0031B861A2
MKNKILVLLLITACALYLFTGCGRHNKVIYEESPDNQEITTITFFGYKYEPENVTVIEQIISEFMEKNPLIRVSYESLKGTDYFEALEKRINSGRGDDVFMVNHDILLELEAQGKVADLSGLSSLANFTDQMQSQFAGQQITWVPTTVSVFGLYCNMDLLKEHKQKVPQTLPEWEAVCDYFVSQGITPVIANNDISLKTLAIGRGFYPAYQENGQEALFDRLNNGEAQLSEYLTEGFEIAEEFIDRGYINREKALHTMKTSDDLQDFVCKESPFMLTGAWAAGRVDAMEPDFEFAVYPLPVRDDGSLLVINADTRLSVNADSEYLDAAMKFVEFFTEAENIQRFADQQSSFSPLRGGRPSEVKEIQPLLSCYESGQTVIGTDDLLRLPIWTLTAKVSERLLEGEPVSDLMKWMDQQAEAERNMQ